MNRSSERANLRKRLLEDSRYELAYYIYMREIDGWAFTGHGE